MNNVASTPRTALLASATGHVGRALLPMLLASKDYRSVDILLRRTPPDIRASPKLKLHQVDFTRLPAALPALDDVLIALGTTIKVDRSEAAFRQVDFEFLVSIARAAGATRLAVVSALGADAKSRVFYNRVKGEMQVAIAQLGYESVVIAQPSLLLGDRVASGQPARSGEVWAARLLGPLGWIVPNGVRPIPARTVASALLAAVLDAKRGVLVLKSGVMQAKRATSPSACHPRIKSVTAM
jgi:uncharacterized protein YbjT (DUF2867 family)